MYWVYLLTCHAENFLSWHGKDQSYLNERCPLGIRLWVNAIMYFHKPLAVFAFINILLEATVRIKMLVRAQSLLIYLQTSNWLSSDYKTDESSGHTSYLGGQSVMCKNASHNMFNVQSRLIFSVWLRVCPIDNLEAICLYIQEQDGKSTTQIDTRQTGVRRLVFQEDSYVF